MISEEPKDKPGYDSIKPGKPWLDTSGKPIHAHGGALIYVNGTYFWYGENKEHSRGTRKIWTWGIRCYSSRDLYNWQDEGLIIKPDTQDRHSPLHPAKRIDRPHILHHEKTGKYICWLKENGKKGAFHILTANSLLGPYYLVKEYFRPNGKSAGDFDLAKDETTGRAYLYYVRDSHPSDGVICVELTDDYLDVTDTCSEHYQGLYPPFCREGIAHFRDKGLHYLLTSGMSGYVPNPSEIAVSTDYHGPFRIMGNPHDHDTSLSSFNSQISQIFKHPKKDNLYIALADRWVPEFVMTSERYKWLSRTIASHYDKKFRASCFDMLKLMKTPLMGRANTSLSTYVWLPLVIKDNKISIRWLDEWRIE